MCQNWDSLLREAQEAWHDCTLQQQELRALTQAVNPYSAEFERVTELGAESEDALSLLTSQQAELRQQVHRDLGPCMS